MRNSKDRCNEVRTWQQSLTRPKAKKKQKTKVATARKVHVRTRVSCWWREFKGWFRSLKPPTSTARIAATSLWSPSSCCYEAKMLSLSLASEEEESAQRVARSGGFPSIQTLFWMRVIYYYYLLFYACRIKWEQSRETLEKHKLTQEHRGGANKWRMRLFFIKITSLGLIDN